MDTMSADFTSMFMSVKNSASTLFSHLKVDMGTHLNPDQTDSMAQG